MIRTTSTTSDDVVGPERLRDHAHEARHGDGAPVQSTGASACRWTGPERRQRRTSTKPTPTSIATLATPSSEHQRVVGRLVFGDQQQVVRALGQSGDGVGMNRHASGCSSGEGVGRADEPSARALEHAPGREGDQQVHERAEPQAAEGQAEE